MENGTEILTRSSPIHVKTFLFTFNNGKNQKKTLKLQIDITVPQNCLELTHRVANHHRIPCFVEPDLKNALQKFIEEEKMKLSDKESSSLIENFKNKPESLTKVAKSISLKYKKAWAQFTSAEKIDEQEQFSTMYHKLIHSKAMTLLLQLEERYYFDVQKVVSDRHNSLTRMRDRQELEMQRTCEHVSNGSLYTEEDVNKLAAQHSAATERLDGEWRAKYEKLVQNQRKEYRDVVTRLYKEMMENNGEVDEHALTYTEVKSVIDISERSNLSSPAKNSRRQNDQSYNGNGSDHMENDFGPTRKSFSPHLEESFTINLGAQMKTMHNIRLVAAPILHFCRHSNSSEDLQAQRLQTVMSLYSNSLSGLVLLVDCDIQSRSGLRTEFSSICEGSTEFHFPSFDEQLEEIKSRKASMALDHLSIKSDDNASLNSSSSEKSFCEGQFQEGDVYITKHSNLSKVHIVFHLAANTSHLKSPESASTVSSRHPTIIGLRHILKIMSSHDVATLMIPILLCHKLNQHVDEAWIVKRAELVMKCMKGFMMEMATWDGGISRTIQFVLPPDISEQTFYRLSSMLPEIFRTTSARNLEQNSFKVPKPAGSTPKTLRH